ncbi:cytochrome P450 [Streptomyces sp. NPDC091377]|uniref:cytochrome P450 n=1 Tax=Streptomyces sp. NPDC091377 TaxID=3365995 RepID=UPI0038282164
MTTTARLRTTARRTGADHLTRAVGRHAGTAYLLSKGYGRLPDLRRAAGGPEAVAVRMLGRRMVALHGPRAVEFFYDERNVRRAVHTLDGAPRRERKALLMTVLSDPDRVGLLVERVREEWERAAAHWPEREPVVLFDETARILARAVCGWAGVPSYGTHETTARDLVAMVDGFASMGPRRLRARRARKRQEVRLTSLIEELRYAGVPSGRTTPAQAVAAHRTADGGRLTPHTGAVELLDILRHVVAVAWFVTFAAHALHRWPQHRVVLTEDEGREEYARAVAEEVRRFYPFVPFLGGVAVADTWWDDVPVVAGDAVLLDVYGHHHDPELWPQPYVFDPDRFLGPADTGGPDLLIPQGGGDPTTGHRCPGEDITLAVLTALVPRLARLPHTVPEQDLTIPLNRIPTRPRSGYVMTDVRPEND